MSIMTIALLMTVILSVVAQLNIKRDIDVLMREYILRVEANGYLTSADQENLKEKLEKLGVEISGWGNTTMSQVGYGEEVILEIEGTVENKMLIANAFNSVTHNESKKTIKLKRTSTAKW